MGTHLSRLPDAAAVGVTDIYGPPRALLLRPDGRFAYLAAGLGETYTVLHACTLDTTPGFSRLVLQDSAFLPVTFRGLDRAGR